MLNQQVKFRFGSGVTTEYPDYIEGSFIYDLDVCKLYLDADGERVGINDPTIMSITWSQLKTKRDSGQLIPGMQYRITDYVCTVANDDEARVVNHPYDIVVTADDNHTLNENAKAILHTGDTYYSANDCKVNLSAWELKYSIDNDTDKFYWADSINGKGVVYYLKDDWGNECPYDFKQIQFKRYKITACSKSPGLVDFYAAKEKSNDITINENDYIWCYTFSVINDNGIIDYSVHQYSYMDDENIMQHCYQNIILPYYYKNFESQNNLYGLNNNVILGSLDDDGFLYNCYSNTFGNACYSNTLGNACFSNIFSNNCQFSTFGNDCFFNTFGNNCQFNTFGNNCFSNAFSNNCQFNTFGNNYSYNTFDNDCSYNTFSNNCHSNTFSNYCSRNTFSNDCFSNTFGNYCSYNTFSNDHVWDNTFEEGCQFITLQTSDTTSNNNKLQYYRVLNGLKGAQNSRVIIQANAGRQYCTFVGKNSSGIIKVWCPADLADAPTVYGGEVS